MSIPSITTASDNHQNRVIKDYSAVAQRPYLKSGSSSLGYIKSASIADHKRLVCTNSKSSERNIQRIIDDLSKCEKRCQALIDLNKLDYPILKKYSQQLIEKLSQILKEKKLCFNCKSDALPHINIFIYMASLRQIGIKLLPDLIKMLDDNNIEKRLSSVITIKFLCYDSPLVISALKRKLSDSNQKIKIFSIMALGMLEKSAQSAIPNLIALLNDSDRLVRTIATIALGVIAFGEDLDDELKMTGNMIDNNFVNSFTALTNHRMDPIAVKFKCPKLGGALITIATPEDKSKFSSISISFKSDRQGRGNLPDKLFNAMVNSLQTMLEDNNPSMRYLSAVILGRLGPKARSAITNLTKTLADKDFIVRMASAIALHKIGGDPQKRIPVLIEAFQYKSTLLREKAAEYLGKIGPQAKIAIPILIRSLSEDYEVAEEASSALSKIGPDAIPALISVLNIPYKHGDYYEKELAAKALGNIGAKATSAIPVLMKILKEEKVRLDYISDALLRIGNSSTLTLLLVEALKNPNPILSSRSVIILGEMGKNAKNSISSILKYLKQCPPDSSKPYMRLCMIGPDNQTTCSISITGSPLYDTIETLRKIGVSDQNVLSALQALRNHEKDYIRNKANAVIAELLQKNKKSNRRESARICSNVQQCLDKGNKFALMGLREAKKGFAGCRGAVKYVRMGIAFQRKSREFLAKNPRLKTQLHNKISTLSANLRSLNFAISNINPRCN